jgi:hypothetical protein
VSPLPVIHSFVRGLTTCLLSLSSTVCRRHTGLCVQHSLFFFCSPRQSLCLFLLPLKIYLSLCVHLLVVFSCRCAAKIYRKLARPSASRKTLLNNHPPNPTLLAGQSQTTEQYIVSGQYPCYCLSDHTTAKTMVPDDTTIHGPVHSSIPSSFVLLTNNQLRSLILPSRTPPTQLALQHGCRFALRPIW